MSAFVSSLAEQGLFSRAVRPPYDLAAGGLGENGSFAIAKRSKEGLI